MPIDFFTQVWQSRENPIVAVRVVAFALSKEAAVFLISWRAKSDGFSFRSGFRDDLKD